MIDRIICPDAAYEQLKESGIVDRILSEPVKSAVRGSLLYKFIEEGAIDDARKKLVAGRLDLESISMNKELLELGSDFEAEDMLDMDFESLLERHPVYLANLVLGEDVLKYEKFGFSDRKALEEAVTSFCLGERHEFLPDANWIWRSGGFKNEILRNMHGDLFVSQMDSSGESYLDKTLFGDVGIFDCMKKVDYHGFGAYQDWSEFLGSLLKYSEKIGMSGIPEIADWEGVLEEVGGGSSGNYSESFGGNSGAEFSASIIMNRSLMCYGEDLEALPFLVSNRKSFALPFFQDSKLLYLRKDEGGDIELDDRLFENDKFLKVVEYGPADLPDAMRATLKYFAREREMIPAIMNEFRGK